MCKIHTRPTTPEAGQERKRIHLSTETTGPTLALTPVESSVRELLVDLAREIDSTSSPNPSSPVILRFTGGWVRDKLLRIPSVDIDVSISNMTGYNFAKNISWFLAANRDNAKYGAIRTGSVHKIESNPERSKHLETATTRIGELDVDFVNLRSEKYNEDSRVPAMEFGTPEADALRRDCTINALFYNLHTQQVEDFTGRGLQDIESRIIRTPLPPRETFMDDPLRVLRLIRFSSRLGFEIDEETKEAMRLPEIKEALATKISRERVQIELDKMLKGHDPFSSLKLIHDLTLYSSIFCPPPPPPFPPTLPTHHMLLAATAVNTHLSKYNPSHHHLTSILTHNCAPQNRYLIWLIAALTPWLSHTRAGDAAKKQLPPAAMAVKEGLKMTNAVTNAVAKALGNSPPVREAIRKMPGWNRGQAGVFIKGLGPDWRSAVVASLLTEVIGVSEGCSGDGGGGVTGGAEVGRVLDEYEAFLRKIHELELEHVYELLVVLGGKQLCGALSCKSGPWLKDALEKAFEWQLNNPTQDRDSALAWARENKHVLIPQ